MNLNYYSALKISIIFLVISSLYIVFSDKIIVQILGSSASIEIFNKIQSFKGLGFVIVTSILLFFLIQKEITKRLKHIQELEVQKENLKKLSDEKEKISNELIKRNSFIQTIIDNIPLGIAVNRFDKGYAKYVYKQYEEIYGWPKKEITYVSNFYEKIYPDKDYRKEILGKIMKDIEKGDPSKMRWKNIEIITQTGEKRIIRTQNIPLFEQNLMISTVQDETEKSRLQKERDLFFDNSIDLLSIAGFNGYMKNINSAWTKSLGWSEREVLSRPWINFVHPEDIKNTKASAKDLNEGKSVVSFRNRYRTKDGRYKWLSWNSIPVFHEELIFSVARDITNEVEMLNKLEFQKKLNKSVFDTAEVGLCVTNETGYFTEVNRAYARIYGYSRDELIGNRLTLLIPPGQHNEALEINEKMMKGEMTLAPRTWKVVNKKGEKLDVLVSAKVFMVDNEKYQITSVLDVTQMKIVQRELESSQERLKQITNNLPGAVIQYKISPEGTDSLTFVSEGSSFIWGVSAMEAQRDNQQIWSRMDERDVGKVKKSIEDSYKHLIPWKTEYRYKLPNGTVKWIEGIGFPQKQEDGSAVWDSLMLDITSRKNAEQEVVETKNLLEKTINSLNDAVFVVDSAKRKITPVNSAVEKIFGYKPSELIGKNTEFLHVNREKYEEFGKKSQAILESGNIFSIEFQMKRKDGSIIETENNVSNIREEDGWRSGLVSIVRDITERKMSERRLSEYQESLKQLTAELSIVEEKQRREFAANIHDHLSQLLVISQMKINDLRKKLQRKEDEKDLEAVSKHIAEALENSRKITYDLSPPVLYELGLIETMYWLTEKLNDEQNINAKFSTDFETLNLPESSLILIFRVIQELVNNALKHAKAKNIEICFNKIDTFFKITIKDDGKGFIVKSNSETKFSEGGFGLFAVKERVNNLEGSFSVDSKPNMGTTI